jgi:hypothetical protein
MMGSLVISIQLSPLEVVNLQISDLTHVRYNWNANPGIISNLHARIKISH